jgi:HORMA domain
VGGTKYKKIVPSGLVNEEAKTYCDWLEEGVFDALSHQYLETVLLEIYDDSNDVKAAAHKSSNRNTTEEAADSDDGTGMMAIETQNADSDAPTKDAKPSPGSVSIRAQPKRRLLEVFSFSVLYPKASGPELSLSRSSPANGSSPAQCSRRSIKHNTSEVLRLLVELSSTLQPLPDNRIISIKLLYSPSTPDDYEPPLFSAAREDSMNCWFENRPLRLTPGRVSTPYHEMSLCIRSIVDVQGGEDDEVEEVKGEDADDEDMDGDREGDSHEERERNENEEMTRGIDTADSTPAEYRENVSDDDMPTRATEVVDIGGSCGNTCRAAPLRNPLSESQSTAKNAIIVDHDESNDKFIAETEEKVNRLSIICSPRTAALERKGGSSFPPTPSSSSRLRLRLYHNPVAIRPTKITPDPSTCGTPARRMGHHLGRPPLPSPLTPSSAATGRTTSRRKVSEVAQPVHQRPKRVRRGALTPTSQAENVSACF